MSAYFSLDMLKKKCFYIIVIYCRVNIQYYSKVIFSQHYRSNTYIHYNFIYFLWPFISTTNLSVYCGLLYLLQIYLFIVAFYIYYKFIYLLWPFISTTNSSIYCDLLYLLQIHLYIVALKNYLPLPSLELCSRYLRNGQTPSAVKLSANNGPSLATPLDPVSPNGPFSPHGESDVLGLIRPNAREPLRAFLSRTGASYSAFSARSPKTDYTLVEGLVERCAGAIAAIQRDLRTDNPLVKVWMPAEKLSSYLFLIVSTEAINLKLCHCLQLPKKYPSKNRKIVIFSKTKSKIKNFSRIKCDLFSILHMLCKFR